MAPRSPLLKDSRKRSISAEVLWLSFMTPPEVTIAAGAPAASAP
jgi:hypothetical protein